MFGRKYILRQSLGPFRCSSQCPYSTRKNFEDMLDKRENAVNWTVLEEGTGADSQHGLQKKDSGQKLKQDDLSVSITL